MLLNGKEKFVIFSLFDFILLLLLFPIFVHAKLNALILFKLLFVLMLLVLNCVLIDPSFFTKLLKFFIKLSSSVCVVVDDIDDKLLAGAIILDDDAYAVDNGKVDGNDEAVLLNNSMFVFI